MPVFSFSSFSNDEGSFFFSTILIVSLLTIFTSGKDAFIILIPIDATLTPAIKIKNSISNQEIRLGKIRRFLPIIKKFNFPVYDLEIVFKDSKKEKPDFKVDDKSFRCEATSDRWIIDGDDDHYYYDLKKQ